MEKLWSCTGVDGEGRRRNPKRSTVCFAIMLNLESRATASCSQEGHPARKSCYNKFFCIMVRANQSAIWLGRPPEATRSGTPRLLWQRRSTANSVVVVKQPSGKEGGTVNWNVGTVTEKGSWRGP